MKSPEQVKLHHEAAELAKLVLLHATAPFHDQSEEAILHNALAIARSFGKVYTREDLMGIVQKNIPMHVHVEDLGPCGVRVHAKLELSMSYDIAFPSRDAVHAIARMMVEKMQETLVDSVTGEDSQQPLENEDDTQEA